MKCKFKWNYGEFHLRYIRYTKWISFTIQYTFLSLSLLSFSSRQTQKVSAFGSQNREQGKPRVGFHGENSCASTHTSLAKVVGRFTHEPGSVGRGLELRSSTQKSEIGGSELQWCAPKGSKFLGLNRLLIDSTDRCEYSATSVDVFTHNFMLWFDLGT